MKDQEFNCSIAVNITPQEGFEMISRVSKWRIKEAKGKTKKLTNEFTVRFGTIRQSLFRLTRKAKGLLINF